MNKNGPIIIIEDDMEDQEMLSEILHDLNYPNEVIFFHDGNDALKYLDQTHVKPFLILSDINMPKINGFELRNKIFINQRLQTKCIPYLFFTTGATKKIVAEAYSMAVQGFFRKPSTMIHMKLTLKRIIEYWQECIAPGEFE